MEPKNLLQAYCRWVEAQAKSHTDFLLLGLGPVVLLALALWFLPVWIACIGLLLLLAPAVYVAIGVLKAYAVRTGRK